MSETTAADAGAWHEPPTGFFGRMVERTARLLGVTHPDAGLAVPASPAGETGLGSSLAHGIAETARAIESKGAAVAGQVAKAAEIYGPTVLKAADVAATDVAAVISVLSLSGDTPASERPRPHAMSMTTTKPLTTAQTKATTNEDTACRATPDDAVGAPSGSARNIDKTLPEALQTSSQTARKNAFFPDPVMRESGLRPFGPTPVPGAQEQCALWQAHHLISILRFRARVFDSCSMQLERMAGPQTKKQTSSAYLMSRMRRGCFTAPAYPEQTGRCMTIHINRTTSWPLMRSS